MTKINLILLGESGVGKSCLLNRFGTGKFTEPYNCTIGAEFHVKKLCIEGEDVTLFIWDTSGQERYRSICRSYYRSGEGVLLVYDVTKPETFYALSNWLLDLKNYNEKAEVLIAGNKNEDPTQKNVAVSMVKNFAAQENLDYIETSAKTGENVDEAFICLARKVLFSNGIITKNQQITGSTSSDQGSVLYEKKDLKDEDTDTIKLGITPPTPDPPRPMVPLYYRILGHVSNACAI